MSVNKKVTVPLGAVKTSDDEVEEVEVEVGELCEGLALAAPSGELCMADLLLS
jgi:hypothetical protein